MMKKNKKTFDAVQTMREIRDRLSEQIKDMTFEEERRFLQGKRLPKRKRVSSERKSNRQVFR